MAEQSHLDAARAAYFAAGGQANDPCRAQKVSRIQVAIANGKDGVLALPPEWSSSPIGLASLASDASPRGEAVAWRLVDHEGAHWWGPSMDRRQAEKAASCSDDLMLQPLYAHPAPATVESDPALSEIPASVVVAMGKRLGAVEPFNEMTDDDLAAMFRDGLAAYRAALAPAAEGRKG